MSNRAAYKKENKGHWPDFKHKAKATRENKRITNRATRRKKKQEVRGMTDREKVLKALEHHKETAVCNGCPYENEADTVQGYCPIYDDVIALLREDEREEDDGR